MSLVINENIKQVCRLSLLFFLSLHYDKLFIFRQGQDFGDEYFAELDMIESVEGRKEGYESDVDEGEYHF